MEYLKQYKACTLCPKMCHANRITGVGKCGMKSIIKVARAALHFWEEPCISGTAGSGTVFFSGCSLHCSFCQNRIISDGFGKEISCERLSEIFMELQSQKANNINLVTPTHFSPDIIEAVRIARKKGLNIPIIYNTSGYETPESVASLSDTVDIFLTDFKYMDAGLAKCYSNASDYPDVAKTALETMVKTIGQITYNNDGIMQRGVIVRHLVLPGHANDSKDILRYLFEKYGENIVLSIMNQYTPMPGADMSEKLSEREYNDVIEYALSIGIEDAYIQEGETARESFIPQFDLSGV